jgi:hypothetical protein
MQTPIRIIGLVEALLSQLLSPILIRVGDAESQEIMIAVAKGIIKPAIDFIIATCAPTSDRSPGKSEHRPMVDSVTSLVDRLLQVRTLRNTVQSASVAGESAIMVCPLAEVIALWSTELVCAKVKHAIDQSSNAITDRIASRRQSTKSTAINALITTFLEIIGRCIGDPSISISSDNVADGQNMERRQKPCIRLVNTRICDLLTKLIAELDSETDTLSGSGHGMLIATGTSTATSLHDATDSHAGNRQSIHALWERIGLDRRTMLAMSCVAEQMMIIEGEDGCEKPSGGSMYGWLKQICGEEQDWGMLS